MRIKGKIITYTVLWGLSLIVAANQNVLSTGGLVFFLCAAYAFTYLNGKHNKNYAETKNSIGNIIIQWIISIYFAFALYGRNIFMRGARFDFSFYNILDFSVFTIALHPIIPGLFSLFELLSSKVTAQRNNEKNNSTRIGLICSLSVFAMDFLLTTSYYPCTMTTDSFGHWQQAIGAVAMSDYSPIAFHFLLKGLFTLTGFTTPYIFVVFQTIILSGIIGDLTAFLYRRGLAQKYLIIGSVMFAGMPSTYMMLLYLSKNPLTGILCLGMVVSLLQVIVESDYYLTKPLWYIKTVLLISGVYLVRENNVVIAAPLAAFVVWFLCQHKNNAKGILLSAGAVLLSIVFITQVVYRTVEYDHADKSHETVRPLLAPVGSAIKQRLDLPKDILEMSDRVLPSEEWTKRYDPFNSDLVTWGNPRPRYKDVSLSEAFSVYFKMLRLYPDVVIKDRMDGMNLIWDISRAEMLRCPFQLEGDVSFKEAKLPDGIIRDAASSLHQLAKTLLEISASEEIFDIFIWHNGIYIVLMMITTVFLVNKKKADLLWAALPSVFILFTYVLIIAWQMYFYIWFFPLTVVTLMITAIVEGSKSRVTFE